MQSFEEEMLQVESEDVERGRPRHPRPGRHGHGPRRPRQDDAARRDPLGARRRARSRRHHAAHRRLRGAGQRPQRRVPRHARSRGVHDDACARRARHRRRRARRRGRRRRHAADEGSDRPREGGRACRSWWRSTRSTRPNANPERVKKELSDLGLHARRVGRRHRHGRRLGQAEAEPRAAARDDPARHRDQRPQGEPEAERVGHRARSQARQGPRPGRHDPRPGRHAPRRRHAHRRHHRRQGPRADRRPRPPDQAGRPVDAGRSARSRRAAGPRRSVPGADRRGQGAADRHLPPDAGQGEGARQPRQPPHARVAAGRRSPKAA